MILKRAIAVVTAAVIGFAVMVATALPAGAQSALQFAPLGFCQIIANAATLITAANCVRASFTGTAAGTALTASAVTGRINIGDALAGTGVPSGTFIAAQVSGTPNGAGVYTTSVATTASAASLTSGGVPQGARSMTISAETQAIRYRDDNQAPTATVGVPIAVGQPPFTYAGSLANIQIINQVAAGIADLAFYK